MVGSGGRFTATLPNKSFNRTVGAGLHVANFSGRRLTWALGGRRWFSVGFDILLIAVLLVFGFGYLFSVFGRWFFESGFGVMAKVLWNVIFQI